MAPRAHEKPVERSAGWGGALPHVKRRFETTFSRGDLLATIRPAHPITATRVYAASCSTGIGYRRTARTCAWYSEFVRYEPLRRVLKDAARALEEAAEERLDRELDALRAVVGSY